MPLAGLALGAHVALLHSARDIDNGTARDHDKRSVMNEAYVKEQVNWYRAMRPDRITNVDPYVLSADAERVLKPGGTYFSGNVR
jgi:hypothetical protein